MKSALDAPRLGTVRLRGLAAGDADDLGVDADRDNERFDSVDLRARNLAGSTFSECEFIDVAVSDADLHAARFNDCVFVRLNAPVLRAPRSSWRDAVIEGSRIGSGELYDSGIHSLHLRHCKVGYLNVRGSTVRDLLFTDCTIDELDLGAATVTRMAFADTRLDLLDVTASTLQHADLRGAELGGIRGIDDLRGATMTELQLAELSPLFAAHLGISIAS